jgi:hypothetical protein
MYKQACRTRAEAALIDRTANIYNIRKSLGNLLRTFASLQVYYLLNEIVIVMLKVVTSS